MADDGIEYIATPPAEAGDPGVTDHGALTGLADDDHTAYATNAELDAHAAAADPHPTYETSAEAAAKVTTHEAAADPHAGYLLESLYDAKGDLLAASADNTPAKVTAGTNGQRLEADSTQTAGLKWSSTTTLLPVAAPSAPASGATLYLDTADSKLKAVMANGDIVVIN